MIDLLGVPFKRGGRGPDAYDCYGLVMEIYRRRRQIELPDFVTPLSQGRIATVMRENAWRWKAVEPRPEVLVFFRIDGLASHVGYALENDRFIHVWEQSGGVVIERLRIGDWKNRIVGFYDYVGETAGNVSPSLV